MNYQLGFWIILVGFIIQFVVMCFAEHHAYWRGYYTAMDAAIAEAEAVLAEKIREKKNS